mgnify:CR=1 FL=1
MGAMGTNLSRNFASHGHSLALYNRYIKGKEEQVALKQKKKFTELKDAKTFESLAAFVLSIKRPRKIIILITAGSALKVFLKKLVPLLSKDDIIIDGGNSHYKETEKVNSQLNKKNIYFLGMGISGGDKGALKGPSLMIGGDIEAYKLVAKDLEKASARGVKGKPCCTYLGDRGAGHFVKMIHNGIEYAEMQLIAEIFSLLMETLEGKINFIQKELVNWQKSSSESYLLGITSEILKYEENNHFFINKIIDSVSTKGTGAWASEYGILSGYPNSLTVAALQARFTSNMKTKRENLSKTITLKKGDATISIKKLKIIYDICRLINHHQGFEMIKNSNQIYGRNSDLHVIAHLWSEGCIIKSQLMKTLEKEFKNKASILEMDIFKKNILEAQTNWYSILNYAAARLIPIPCISSSWNFLVSMTQGKSSGNIIQAQRDYFGAHGIMTLDNKKGEIINGPWRNKN